MFNTALGYITRDEIWHLCMINSSTMWLFLCCEHGV